MKRGGPSHPKTLALAAALRLPRYAAVGLLECLFHFVGAYAPAGDVGRLSDADIAYACGWDRGPEELIAALVAARYLDVDNCHRLLLHDWHEHADQAVQRALTRKGAWFVTKRKKVRKASSLEARSHLASRGLMANGSSSLGEEVQEKGARTAAELREAFTLRFWPTYPPRNGQRAKRAEAMEQWLKLKPDVGLEAEILAAVKRYGQTDEYPVDAVRWLRHRRWEDETNARVAPKRTESPAAAIPDAKPTLTPDERQRVAQMANSWRR